MAARSKAAPSQRHGLSSSPSVRNHHRHRASPVKTNTTSGRSSSDENSLEHAHETEDEIHTRRIIKALADQSYHLPGYGYWEDMIQWFLNNHPVLGIFFHHPLHPIGCGMRMLGFFASGVFGLAITNLVWLWFIYEEDETQFTVDLSEASKANLTAYIGDVNESNELQITNGVIYLWTVGGALHGWFDTTIWKLSMCSCCEGLQAQGKYKRFGVGLMTFGIILITACTTLIVVFRATFESNQDAEIAELKSAGLFDDAIELGSGASKDNYQFLLSYSVELALALVVYFPIFGVLWFSGILACKKKIPILGGRPYEVYLYEKEVAEEEEEARRRSRRKDEFADEDIGGLRNALTKRASTLFAGRKASVHGGMSSNRMNSSRADFNASSSRLNSSRADFNASSPSLNSSRADLNASSSRLNSSRADLNASNSRMNSSRDDLSSSLSRLNSSQDDLVASISRLNSRRNEFNSSGSRLNMSNSRMQSSRADFNASSSRMQSSLGELNFSDSSIDLDEELGLEQKRPSPSSSSRTTSRESSRNLERDTSSRFTSPIRSSRSASPKRSSSRDRERSTPTRTSSRESDRDDHSRYSSPRRTSSRESDRYDHSRNCSSRRTSSRESDRDDHSRYSPPKRSSSRESDRDNARYSSPRGGRSRHSERDDSRHSSRRDGRSRHSHRDDPQSSSEPRRNSSSRRNNRGDSKRGRSRDGCPRTSSSRDLDERSTRRRSSSRNSADSRSQGDYESSTPTQKSSRSSDRSVDSRSHRDRGSSSNRDSGSVHSSKSAGF